MLKLVSDILLSEDIFPIDSPNDDYVKSSLESLTCSSETSSSLVVEGISSFL